jgi:hypothetical protein
LPTFRSSDLRLIGNNLASLHYLAGGVERSFQHPVASGLDSGNSPNLAI